MNRRIRTFLFLLLLAAGVSSGLPEKMQPSRMVNDYAGILAPDRIRVLEDKLRNFADTTSTQIVVAIVPDLEGYAAGDYAVRLAEKWGVGQKGKDNGILVLVKPKTASSKGEVFIAVGYGLEGAVPDIAAKRVVEEKIIPAFRTNDYYGGIDAGVSTLMGLVSGEYTADALPARNKAARGIPIGIIIFAAIVLLTRKSSYTVQGKNSRHTATPGMPFIFFGGGRKSGGDDFGSFSGGGFGGFGGGSFGGGGAGGSW